MLTKELIGEIRRIEITTRSLVESLFSGEYHSVFKGRGMEFDQVREYQDGDDVRAIDWNVTARMNRPFVKEFVEERELVVMLLADRSASMEFGTRREPKSRIAAKICSLIAFSAIQNNDNVGLILFSDRVEKYIAPRKGKRHVLRVIRELVYPHAGGSGTDLVPPLEHLNRVQRRRSVVFLVSDFLRNPPEKLLRVTNRRHDVIAIRVADARERGPGGPREAGAARGMRPPGGADLEGLEKGGRLAVARKTGPVGPANAATGGGFAPLGSADFEDLETGETVSLLVDRGFVDGYDAERRESDGRLRALFRRNGVDLVPVGTDGNYIDPLVRFFRERERRLRR
ncbi:MAG: DUF58 domain-containing protein [Candidatus Eisenbacteria bacterium]